MSWFTISWMRWSSTLCAMSLIAIPISAKAAQVIKHQDGSQTKIRGSRGFGAGKTTEIAATGATHKIAAEGDEITRKYPNRKINNHKTLLQELGIPQHLWKDSGEPFTRKKGNRASKELDLKGTLQAAIDARVITPAQLKEVLNKTIFDFNDNEMGWPKLNGKGYKHQVRGKDYTSGDLKYMIEEEVGRMKAAGALPNTHDITPQQRSAALANLNGRLSKGGNKASFGGSTSRIEYDVRTVDVPNKGKQDRVVIARRRIADTSIPITIGTRASTTPLGPGEEPLHGAILTEKGVPIIDGEPDRSKRNMKTPHGLGMRDLLDHEQAP